VSAGPEPTFFRKKRRIALCGEPRSRPALWSHERVRRAKKKRRTAARHVFEIVGPAIRPTRQRTWRPRIVIAPCYLGCMTRIVAVANQKGGVGKTTTAINLSASVASRGYRVLLVDFDPQGNASSGVGYTRDRIELTVYDALTGEVTLADVIRPTEITTLFLAPANTELVGAEIELISVERRERFLADALATVAAPYDYIVIDCPPSLGLLTLNALVAADGVIIPMQAEYFALEGLSALTATIEKVRTAYNPNLTIDGVVFTMYDARLSIAVQVRNEVEKYFGKKVFDEMVPRNVRLSEAPSFGKPVLLYDLRCQGAKSYLALADEFIDRTLAIDAPQPLPGVSSR
jgi:chromosome partitioning protein